MYKHNSQAPEIIEEELSIVMLGDFNPRIFQPFWFSNQKLIRDSEAEAANVELIHTDFTSFSTDWFVMQVARERFTVTTKASAYKRHLFDLASGTFKSLIHTPVNQMGLNVGKIIRFKSQDDWHSFGHFAAPKSAWGDILDTPGLRNLVIESSRGDDHLGSKSITIQPVLNGQNTDVSIKFNSHFDLDEKEKKNGANYFVSIIEQEYEKNINESNEMLNNLIKKFIEQTEFDNGKNK